MLYDADEINPGALHKIRCLVRELVPEIDPEKFYEKHQLYSSKYLSNESHQLNRHVMNWLYTVKCETGASGKRFIDTVLWGLKSNLKRNLDDMQYTYIKALIYIFIKERELWK